MSFSSDELGFNGIRTNAQIHEVVFAEAGFIHDVLEHGLDIVSSSAGKGVLSFILDRSC